MSEKRNLVHWSILALRNCKLPLASVRHFFGKPQPQKFVSLFLLLLILQRAFLPAFAKMTPDALVSTRCWQKSCPLLSTTGKTSKMPNTNAEKFFPHLLLQPAGGKMAGSRAGQQKSSKSFSRLTAFAGRAGGGWYLVLWLVRRIVKPELELTVD